MAEEKTEPDLSQRLAGITYRALRWGRDHLPPGVRTIVGLLFMLGGVLGFLPILGFWMLPLGVAFVALDIPMTSHKIDDWMVSLKAKARGEAHPGAAPDSEQPADEQNKTNG